MGDRPQTFGETWAYWNLHIYAEIKKATFSLPMVFNAY